ncbi:MAG: hypothetical protein D6782_05895 [Alphaproteobacteria bacterium]|nr:MAG: hypothetical protein D6782_05895 [Alphaproteobacteria bacterium]
MAKTVHNDVLDAAFNVVKNSCDKITLLTGQPATFADANTGVLVLASITMAPADFTLADGDVSGRKLTVAEKAGTGSASGTAAVLAMLDTVGSRILYTTDGNFTVTNAQAFTLQSFKAEIADPA